MAVLDVEGAFAEKPGCGAQAAFGRAAERERRCKGRFKCAERDFGVVIARAHPKLSSLFEMKAERVAQALMYGQDFGERALQGALWCLGGEIEEVAHDDEASAFVPFDERREIARYLQGCVGNEMNVGECKGAHGWLLGFALQGVGVAVHP